MKKETPRVYWIWLVILSIFSLSNYGQPTPTILGCNCNQSPCTSSYVFENQTSCDITLRWQLSDVSTSTTSIPCASQPIVNVAAGANVCLISCTDFNSCPSATIFNIAITVYEIGGVNILTNNTVSHDNTSTNTTGVISLPGVPCLSNSQYELRIVNGCKAELVP